MSDPGATIVIFDTDCVLCSRWIRFVLRHEASDHMRFASSRKPNGQRLAEAFGIAPEALDLTYVVIDQGRAYTRSAASLVLVRYLRRPWCWLAVLGMVPRPVRDRVYDSVARNRLRWFGAETDCFLPAADQRHRFLD